MFVNAQREEALRSVFRPLFSGCGAKRIQWQVEVVAHGVLGG